MQRSAIVLVIDRLSAGFVGSYGNTWIDTPQLNRLAAESLLADFAITDTPDLTRVYRSYWQGQHALAERDCQRSLPGMLEDAGVPSVLVTDGAEIANLDIAQAFCEQTVLAADTAAQPAEDIGQTRFAQLIATAIARWEELEEPSCLWIHARGMAGNWDAPWELRNRYADEGDPSPPTFVRPPVERLGCDIDPDMLLGLQQAYAGQVTSVDACLGPLLDVLDTLSGSRSTLLAVTSPRGYPLGEHGRVGDVDGALYGELLHVPFLIRHPDLREGSRIGSLVQPPDLFRTLCEWFQLPADLLPRWGRCLHADCCGETSPRDQVACAVSGEHHAIRTPAWFAHSAPDQPDQLFTKPDDRWEINEVSDLCRDVIEELGQLRVQFQQAVAEDDPGRIPPLSGTLISGFE